MKGRKIGQLLIKTRVVAKGPISCSKDTADFEAGHKIDVPALALWGAKSHTGKVYDDVLDIWRRYAGDVQGGAIDCGHYVQEEAPRETLKWLSAFFI